MLSRIEAICGAFPRRMIAQGRQSGRFFTKSGLLYELVESDEKVSNPNYQIDDEQGLFDVFQPKRTTIAARLGFDPDELERGDQTESFEQSLFVDFCKSMLVINPDGRLSAAEALEHPWIVSSESLTEQDIKYPSG
jgi:serine/threonine protein kinase